MARRGKPIEVSTGLTAHKLDNSLYENMGKSNPTKKYYHSETKRISSKKATKSK